MPVFVFLPLSLVMYARVKQTERVRSSMVIQTMMEYATAMKLLDAKTTAHAITIPLPPMLVLVSLTMRLVFAADLVLQISMEMAFATPKTIAPIHLHATLETVPTKLVRVFLVPVAQSIPLVTMIPVQPSALTLASMQRIAIRAADKPMEQEQ
jgi:hypothetical protein